MTSIITSFPFPTRLSLRIHRRLSLLPLRQDLRHITTSSLSPSSSTTTTTPTILQVLEQRGLLDSLTSPTLHSLSTTTTTTLKVYCGFDPTAESLHLGNLIAIIVLSWFHKLGHHPFAVLGGATARVGDPSGKSTERPELPLPTLLHNSQSIHHSLSSIFSRQNCHNLTILNNYDWWKDVTFLDFLKTVGRHARVGPMLSKESVKTRLESERGLSFTEFSYQLLQGYDFVHLFKNEGVRVQIGGSDQWGNITAGIELIRKILGYDDNVFGLTFPLLLKSDGTKFGKSEDGAIWLSPKLLSPYKFYQYFFTIPDVDVVRFLKVLTFLEMDEIEEIGRGMGEVGYVPNSAQRRLAEEVTRFVHGEDGLEEAINATEALKPGAGGEVRLDWKTIEGIAKDVPSCSLGFGEVVGVSVVDVSVLAGLLDSKSAARRMVKQGGLYLNNCRVGGEGRVIEDADIVDGKVLLLSAGKKNKMVIRIS